ncbi:MAG: class I SAM-dependent RNA methyltransferase [Clostridia bacterium]|nr:class I SAM-dependent RNA methyltransferase [Clostridia bacterium]
MMRFEIVVTTMFGLEALVAKEIRNLGYETTEVIDGRVTFLGDFEAVARVNLWLRCGERVFIKVGEFDAVTFDELFEKTKSLDWSKWLLKDSEFPVNGFCVKSQLFSVRDCQAIIKKGIVESLTKSYKINWFPETGSLYKIEFSIIKDKVALMIDTSGDSLHKRGYRRRSNMAPLKETIAAAIVTMSRFSYNGVFCDPFCGSGTIPIEAAMIAKNIAPGLNRHFAFEGFKQMSKNYLKDAREEALSEIRKTNLKVIASDIDYDCVDLTINNAKLARVNDVIFVKRLPVADFKSEETGGTIVCNPPYGERLLTLKESEKIIKDLGRVYKNLLGWNMFVITPNEKFETLIGKKATKKRKLYNGMLKCDLYQYFSKADRL